MLTDEREMVFMISHHQHCWNSEQFSAAMRDFMYFAGPCVLLIYSHLLHSQQLGATPAKLFFYYYPYFQEHIIVYIVKFKIHCIAIQIGSSTVPVNFIGFSLTP